ncbi:CcdC family protein [Alteribacter natronophilus]|uniref:CcdC family protein n=1 Tax=Alteribacter natronophilus TaxID=2583810 RepID=UPI00110E99D6|nr:cytochrome c biogenesis protein CcdC [Alteribacter natronophilus]TMW73314.1 cytochrome c biogenesis protein CcdC [Alteribacter natronophilus]
MLGIVFTLLAVVMGLAALFIRMKAMKKPANTKKIIIPPVAMSTGFLMFVYEPARITSLQFAEAFAVGVVFSLLLIKTSKFEIRDQDIYMVRTKAFAFILIGLLALRVTFKLVFGHAIQVEELAGMFFVLAFGMILPWRIAMLVKFNRMKRELAGRTAGPIPVSQENPAP